MLSQFTRATIRIASNRRRPVVSTFRVKDDLKNFQAQEERSTLRRGRLSTDKPKAYKFEESIIDENDEVAIDESVV